MTITETVTIGKKSPATCEDGVVASADYVAVIDGSTSKSPIQARSDMRNGRLAMLTLKHAIESAPPHLDCAGFCRHITNALALAHQRYGISHDTVSTHPECRLTASLAVYSAHANEVWMIGDCQCMIDGVTYENPKPQEPANALRRAAAIRRMLDSGEQTIESLRRHDAGRDLILDDIIESCKGQNVTFAVADGTDIAMEHVKKIPVMYGVQVILASDGYPVLMPTLKESEEELSRIISEDPLLIGSYKATKGVMAGNVSFDDRCYVRFSP